MERGARLTLAASGFRALTITRLRTTSLRPNVRSPSTSPIEVDHMLHSLHDVITRTVCGEKLSIPGEREGGKERESMLSGDTTKVRQAERERV